jgi:hypothetical protein
LGAAKTNLIQTRRITLISVGTSAYVPIENERDWTIDCLLTDIMSPG